MDTRVYWIWLQQRLGIGSPKVGPLLEHCEHPRRLYEADEATLRSWGVPPLLTHLLSDKSLDEAQRVLEQTTRLDCWTLTPDDMSYPKQLLQLPGFPLVLYGRGDLPQLDDLPAIAIVGTRTPSPYGSRVGYALAAGLAAGGMAIVSGGAVGIDAIAMQAAVDYEGLCIGFQACGMDIDYPSENRKLREELVERGGVLMTEFPLGTRPHPHNFRPRNRLMSGVSCGTLVVEAGNRSGSLITAHWAVEQGRDVFAVPGEVNSPVSAGCHRLLKEGAHLACRCRDILQPYVERYGDRLSPDDADTVEAYWLKHPERRRDQLSHAHSASSFRQGPKAASAARTRGVAERVRNTAGRPPDTAARPGVSRTRPVRETAAPLRQEPALPHPSAAQEPPRERPACPDDVSPLARRVLEKLAFSPQPVDEIAALLGERPAAVLAALTELEMQGCARCHAGGQYSLR